MTLTVEEFNGRAAMLRLEAAFMSLMQDPCFANPEIAHERAEMDRACREFFNACNAKIFAQPVRSPLAKSTVR